ncbi:hypothetical protein QEN19_003869 [Hanseniaspora menglaensis]
MNRLLQQMGGGKPGLGTAPVDSNMDDSKETVYISPIALLKMLRHGRAGVPMEVMGLMLGSFVDEYTVNVVDVFAMPQSGTGVSVEAVDDVFQTKMMEMLEQTGRLENVVGWYHSHPGFGCWLSSVDVNTQKTFEQLTARAVAVVVDPIQSVKGKVVIDAFRLIDPSTMMKFGEPRQTTSNVPFLNKPNLTALVHGLNKAYYSLNIDYLKNTEELDLMMLLHKKQWTKGLILDKGNDLDEIEAHCNHERDLENLTKLTKLYNKKVEEEIKKKEQVAKDEQVKDGDKEKHEAKSEKKESESFEKDDVRYVGKQDPKKHLTDMSSKILQDNIIQVLTNEVNANAIKM